MTVSKSDPISSRWLFPAQGRFINSRFIDFTDIPRNLAGDAKTRQPAVNMQGIEDVSDPVQNCYAVGDFHVFGAFSGKIHLRRKTVSSAGSYAILGPELGLRAIINRSGVLREKGGCRGIRLPYRLGI
jgi:hypothetical protein